MKTLQQDSYFLTAQTTRSRKQKDLSATNQSSSFRIGRSSIYSSSVNSRKNKSNLKQLNHQKLIDERIKEYNQTSCLKEFHDQILSSLKCMPAEVIHSLNINQFVQKAQNDKDQNINMEDYRQQAEFQLIQAAQDIEDKIIKKIFEPQRVHDKQDNDKKLSPYQLYEPTFEMHKFYSTKMLFGTLKILSFSLNKLLKWMHSFNSKLGVSLENIWKSLILLIDLHVQWSNDQQSIFVQDQVQDRDESLNKTINNYKVSDEKLRRKLSQKEKNLNDLGLKYTSLQFQFESLANQYGQVMKQTDDDMRYVSEGGGVYHIQKNVQELEYNLLNLKNQTRTNCLNFQSSMKGVASSILNLNSEPSQSLQSKMIGLNQIRQAPGDIAFGHLMSQHPWITYLKLQRFVSQQEQEVQSLNLLEKQELLHDLLTQPISDNCSQINSLIQFYGQNGLGAAIQIIRQLIKEEYDESLYDFIFFKFFNLRNLEGFQLFHFNNIKRIYGEIIRKLANSSLKYHIFDTRIETFTLYYLRDIIQNYYQEHIDQIWKSLQLEEMESISLIRVMSLLINQIYQIDKQQHCERITEFQHISSIILHEKDLFQLSVAQSISEKIFVEYIHIDKYKILNYITWRYFVLYDYDIGEKGIQNEKEKPDQGSDHNKLSQFMLDCVQRIKTILIFNPNAFDGYNISPEQTLDSKESIQYQKRKYSINTPQIENQIKTSSKQKILSIKILKIKKQEE